MLLKGFRDEILLYVGSENKKRKVEIIKDNQTR